MGEADVGTLCVLFVCPCVKRNATYATARETFNNVECLLL